MPWQAQSRNNLIIYICDWDTHLYCLLNQGACSRKFGRWMFCTWRFSRHVPLRWWRHATSLISPPFVPSTSPFSVRTAGEENAEVRAESFAKAWQGLCLVGSLVSSWWPPSDCCGIALEKTFKVSVSAATAAMTAGPLILLSKLLLASWLKERLAARSWKQMAMAVLSVVNVWKKLELV